MTAKNVFILAGLTVLSVFAVSAVWEFGLEDLAFQSPASDETSESDAERWRDILAATLAAAIASILPGFITLRSIAQRQIFERALVDSSQRFRDFAESSSDWFWELDRSLGVIYLSDSFLRRFSLSLDETIGDDHFDLWPGLTGQNRDWYTAAIEYRQPIRNIDYETLLPDGSMAHFRINGKPVFDANGVFQGYRGTGQDITAEIETRQKIEEAEIRLRNAIEAISEGFLMFDADNRLVLCNSKFRELYDMSADLFVPGANCEDILRAAVPRGQYPDAIGRTDEWIAERMKQMRAPGQPIERQLPNGRWVKIADTRTPDGGMVGIRTNITDLIAREQQLRESEERYRRLVDLSPDGIMVHCDGETVFCNMALAKILGAESPEQIIGRPAMDFISAEDHRGVLKRRDAAKNGAGMVLRETIYVRLDGTKIDVERCLVNITWQGKEAFMVLARDITERKQREHRLRQTQKMESLGTLAGGIAHDLNNTLVPVLGLTELIMQDLPDSSDIRTNLEIVAAAAERSQELVEQILKFSRSEEANRKIVDLCRIIREALPLLRATLPAAIKIHDDIDDADALTVNADPVQIHQILMNLGSNASQAMGLEPGTLSIRLESVDVDALLAARHPGMQASRCAKLTVSDTGPGIHEDTLERIFDPFFTTKDVGKGTGLGLSVVHAIVEAHGGVIVGSNQPAQGANFEIFLPLKSADMAQSEPLRSTA